jgi:hypothetical protein
MLTQKTFIPWIFFFPFWKNLQQVTSNELLQVTITKSLSKSCENPGEKLQPVTTSNVKETLHVNKA